MRKERRRIEPIASGLTADQQEQLAEFARNLQAFRKDRGWTQSDLAREVWGETTESRTGKRVAKNRDMISRWESGNSCPSEIKLREVCDATGWAYEKLAPSMMASKLETEQARVQLREVVQGQTHIKINALVPSLIAAKINMLLQQTGDEDEAD